MASRNPEQPNIVMILTDDQGYWALGCYGNDEIRTPNLDRLAKEGVRFENFYCTSPVCSPARASLFTGKIPSQHGVQDWIREGNVADPIGYLDEHEAYTEILADNGYVCGLSGKWHLGDSRRKQKGFTHWYAHPTGGSQFYNAPMFRNGELVNDSGYITDLITDDAVEFIRNQNINDSPFYASIHYTAPHSPWVNNHPQDIVESYDACLFESCPQEPKHPWSPPRLGYIGAPDTWEDMDIRENLKGYFASVTALDAGVGTVMQEIEALGLKESTLICFMSDNGFNCGHHGIWGKGNGTVPVNMYETSVKIPAIMSQPGRIQEGFVSSDLLSGYDFMPTLLDFTGFECRNTQKLPGSSFLPLLYGDKLPGNRDIVIYDEYGPARMIRNEQFKYVHRYQFGPHELYDLENDPQERYNLFNYKEYKHIVHALRAKLDVWFNTYAEPDVDAVKQPITGKGQIGLVGKKGNGAPAFYHYDVVESPLIISLWESNNPGGK